MMNCIMSHIIKKISNNKTYEERAGIFKGLLETPSYPVRKYYELFGAKFYKEGEREQMQREAEHPGEGPLPSGQRPPS